MVAVNIIAALVVVVVMFMLFRYAIRKDRQLHRRWPYRRTRRARRDTSVQ